MRLRSVETLRIADLARRYNIYFGFYSYRKSPHLTMPSLALSRVATFRCPAAKGTR